MKNKNYPLYQTTEFENFRVMVENVADRFPDRTAIAYKKNPQDKAVVEVSYREARDHIRSMATGLIALGFRDRHIALIGEASYDWVCSYFALMAIGSVVVPLDRDLPADDMVGIMNTAECEAVLYSPSIETRIRSIKGSIPSLKWMICMGEPKDAEAMALDSICAEGAAQIGRASCRVRVYM